MRRKIDNKNEDDLFEEKPSFAKKFVDFKNKMYLDDHHTIERRGIMMTTAMSLLIIGALWAFIGGHFRQVAKDNQVTTLATDVSFSKTAEALTLSPLKASPDNKMVYIPFTFSDLTQISTKADNYTVSVLDATGKVLHGPSGKMTIYGTTTNAVIALRNGRAFGTGPVRIIIRNNKSLTDPTAIQDNTSGAKAMQALAAKYDIASFVVNPGSTGIKKSDVVSPSAKVSDSYTLLFGQKQLDKNEKAIKADDDKLKSLYNRESEYRHRLESAGFKVPGIPNMAKPNYVPNAADANNLPQSPDDIKNAQGKTTADVSNDASDNAGATDNDSSTPATDWAQLTQTWENISQTKIDKHVTLDGQRDQIKKTISDLDSVATSSSPRNFGIAH